MSAIGVLEGSRAMRVGETDDLRLWGCENGGGGRQGHRDGRGHGGRHLFVFSQRDFLQEMVSASP